MKRIIGSDTKPQEKIIAKEVVNVNSLIKMRTKEKEVEDEEKN